MKSSNLKRKTPLRAVSERKRKPSRRKETRFRSAEYLSFVRSLPCCACGITPCDAHHVVGIYGASGMGLKAEDSLSMALCRACHMELHREPGWLQHQPGWLKKTIEAGLGQFPAGAIHDALIEARDFVIRKQEVGA